MVIDVRPLQYWKARTPKLSTDSGTIIEGKALQYEKVPSLIAVRELESVTEARSVH